MSDIKEVKIGEDIFIIKDQNAVKKAGDTMTGALTLNGTTVPLIMKGVVNPSNTGTYQDIQCIGTDNNRVGGIRFQKGTDINTVTIYSTKYNTNTFSTVLTCNTNSAGKRVYSPVQLISTWYSGYNGYRIWSDGYCEQWGNWGANTSSWASASVTFHKKFKDTNFNLFVQGNWSDAASSSCKVTARSETGFTGTHANNLYSTMPSYWKACGILADDQY